MMPDTFEKYSPDEKRQRCNSPDHFVKIEQTICSGGIKWGRIWQAYIIIRSRAQSSGVSTYWIIRANIRHSICINKLSVTRIKYLSSGFKKMSANWVWSSIPTKFLHSIKNCAHWNFQKSQKYVFFHFFWFWFFIYVLLITEYEADQYHKLQYLPGILIYVSMSRHMCDKVF